MYEAALNWLTPTCVGRTPEPEALTLEQEAHPHVRGEDR